MGTKIFAAMHGMFLMLFIGMLLYNLSLNGLPVLQGAVATVGILWSLQSIGKL